MQSLQLNCKTADLVNILPGFTAPMILSWAIHIISQLWYNDVIRKYSGCQSHVKFPRKVRILVSVSFNEVRSSERFLSPTKFCNIYEQKLFQCLIKVLSRIGSGPLILKS